MKRTIPISIPISIVLFIAAALFVPAAVPGYGKSPGKKFEMPAFEKFVLKNGLTVYLMEHHEVPLIYVSAVFRAGAVKDGKHSGLASLTADSMLLGTKNYTKQQIEENLDFIGASYSSGAALELAEVSVSFINTDRETVFPILKDIIVNPVFPAEEVKKRKKRLLLELEQAKERPNAVIEDYYSRFLYGTHPYGNTVEGTKKTVSAIGVEHLKSFHAANYTPSNSAIAIVGDFKTRDMKKTVKKLFNDWKPKETPAPVKLAAPAASDASRVLLVNKEDAAETQFMIGNFGIRRGNPDYIEVQVINTILGGRFTSWLNDALRVNAGLTYGAYSHFSANKTSGSFFISSYTKTATTIEAIDLALKMLNQLHQEGLDQKTLDSAKKYIMGQFPPEYETAGDMASVLTDMFIYQFDESYIDNFQDTVNNFTLEKAKKIIKKYFPKENLQFVLIGKAADIRAKVKKYGKIIEKDIKTDGF